MTLDKLLGASLTDWEAMSDADLERILSPLFTVTRPTAEKAQQVRATTKASKGNLSRGQRDNLMKEVQQLMELANKKNNPV